MTQPNKTTKKLSEARILKIAEHKVQNRLPRSPILAVEEIPTFAASELELGEVIGRGAFSVVRDVKKINIRQSESRDVKKINIRQSESPVENVDGDIQDRKFMARNCLRNGAYPRYAVKSLQAYVQHNPEFFVRSLVDLVVETKFLATLDHPNIIKMRGTAKASPFEPNSTYFIVLDKLHGMLSKRLCTTWKYNVHGTLAKLLGTGKKGKQICWIERLTASRDIANALGYLHGMSIVYRDLKSENVGFDANGTVKIFDFGLARELDPSLRDKDGTYLMTGDVGSLRYMAPEVALSRPYNETCDVYSFCILLWQILKVETPFEAFSRVESFQFKVFTKGIRPRFDPKWPKPLIDAMTLGWGFEIKQRPSITQMEGVIDQILFQETGERRSTMENTFEKGLIKSRVSPPLTASTAESSSAGGIAAPSSPV